MCHDAVVAQTCGLGKRAGHLLLDHMTDLSERLLTHFVGGRWRVPFATRQATVLRPDGSRAGAAVLAGRDDVMRAAASLRGADMQACRRLADMLEPLGLSPAMTTGTPIIEGPAILCFDDRDRGLLGAALLGGLRHGVIWCPPLSATLFATELTERLQKADLPPGALSVLHADTPQTRAHLCAAGLPVLGPAHM